MSLPFILALHTRPVGGLAPTAAPSPVSMAPLGGAVPLVDSFAFVMQPQMQTNWCWAAVSTSVSHYYNATSVWTQCSVANSELGQSSCCVDGSTPACNVPWYLDRALTLTGNFRSLSNSPEPFANVQSLVNAREPLGVRIGWSGGGGHFVALHGYATIGTDQFVDVEDPIYGASTVRYVDFCTSYQATGTWTHSYRTQS
jgi:hypothetical protein